jgi:hypothetical protein
LRKERTKYLIVFLFIILLLTKGCGIFDTRTPETPASIRSTFVPPTTPALLITDLQFSIQEKNSVNYSKCLNQFNFQYVPDSKSQQIYGQIFQNWNSASEKNYLDNLISQTNASASSTLFLDNPNTTYITPDSVVYKADYIIVFQHNRNNIPKSATGNLLLILNSDVNNLFSITKWEDFRQNDTTFTWSELKANFSN